MQKGAGNLSAFAGERLRELRKAAGLSQRELAERVLNARGAGPHLDALEVGNEQSRISRLEKGKTEFSLRGLEEFAAALGVGVGEFLPGAGVSLRPEVAALVEAWEVGGPAAAGRYCLGFLENPKPRAPSAD